MVGCDSWVVGGGCCVVGSGGRLVLVLVVVVVAVAVVVMVKIKQCILIALIVFQ